MEVYLHWRADGLYDLGSNKGERKKRKINTSLYNKRKHEKSFKSATEKKMTQCK